MTLATRTIVFLAWAWLAAVFDSGIAPLLSIGEVAPNACMLAALLCVVLNAAPYSFLGSGIFGIAADLAGTSRLGPALACFTLVGYGITRLPIHGRPVRQAAALVAGSTLLAWTMGLLQYAFHFSAAASSIVLKHSTGVGFYTAACAIALFAATRLAQRGD
jgi:hypothetical protein